MAFIPQELVNTIVAEVDDVSALKACSLAGSAFRDATQRGLFQSITLTSWPHSVSQSGNYAAACALFAQSPHLATYVLDLKILLQNRRADLDHLQRILPMLVKARRCIIDGYVHQFRWHDMTEGLDAAFSQFFSRETLRELRLFRIIGTGDSVFLGATPSLSFYNVQIADVIFPEILSLLSPVRDLNLRFGTEDISNWFASPRVRSHMAQLRRLSRRTISCHLRKSLRGHRTHT
ncbi:hypothetical protein C8R47DRAFT_399561 [Mycena vitilis]|nr:hypothetical protein C8R47DRAFT_399561 [Mycena vitilis]